MSKIPYTFDTPIPDYFRKKGFLPLDNMEKFFKSMKFLMWSFAKCKSYAREVFFDGRLIKLEPFEFIYGRGTSAKDSGLTEGELRNQLNTYQNAEILKKTTNSVANRFTCYIWVTSRFNGISQPTEQPAEQPTEQPTEQPQTRSKIVKIEELQTSAKKVVVFSCLENLALSEEEKEKLMEFSEERIKLAVAFSKLETPTKTLYAQLRWHCKSLIPPISSKAKFTPQQYEALKYNEEVKGKHYETNKEAITKNHMYIFVDGIYQTISLKSDLRTIQKDLNQSRNELNKQKAK